MKKNTNPVREEESPKQNTKITKIKQDTDECAPKRMTVVLPHETSEMLNVLSKLQSITLNEAIRRAISTEAFIRSEIGKNSKILVKTEDGETKELIFR